MGSPVEGQLTDNQVEKVLVCFLREVFRGNLKLIDQRGWDNFEVLRVSANARQRWGLDMCIQMLFTANRNIKDNQSHQQTSLNATIHHSGNFSG